MVVGQYCKHLSFIGSMWRVLFLSCHAKAWFCFLLSPLVAWVICKWRQYRVHLSEILEIFLAREYWQRLGCSGARWLL